MPQLQTARSEHCLVLTPEQKILAIGGQDSQNQLLDSIEILDSHDSEWQLLEINLPVPLRNFNAVTLPQGVLVFGGIDSNKRARQECFMIQGSNRVQMRQSLPHQITSKFASVVSPSLDTVYTLSG